MFPPTAWTQKNGGFVPPLRTGTNERQLDCHPPSLISAESCSIVGALKRVASGRRHPRERSISENTRTAASEWPPRSKKLSFTPIALRPSIFCQTHVSLTSSSSLALSDSPSLSVGSNIAFDSRRRRSIFPLPFSANSS